MNSTKLTMTAPKPSFGMPVHGSAFPAAACPTGDHRVARVYVDGVVVRTADLRVRPIAGASWDTPAWRPSLC